MNTDPLLWERKRWIHSLFHVCLWAFSVCVSNESLSDVLQTTNVNPRANWINKARSSKVCVKTIRLVDNSISKIVCHVEKTLQHYFASEKLVFLMFSQRFLLIPTWKKNLSASRCAAVSFGQYSCTVLVLLGKCSEPCSVCSRLFSHFPLSCLLSQCYLEVTLVIIYHKIWLKCSTSGHIPTTDLRVGVFPSIHSKNVSLHHFFEERPEPFSILWAVSAFTEALYSIQF